MKSIQLKRAKSNSILFGIVGVVLVLNSVLLPFEDNLLLFYAQLIIGAFSIFVAIWDRQNVFIEFSEDDFLIIKPGLGIPKKFISFNDIAGYELRKGVKVDLLIKGESHYPVFLRLDKKEKEEFFQLLDMIINEVG